MSSVSRSTPPDVEQNPFSMPLFPDRKLSTQDLPELKIIEFISVNLPEKPKAEYEKLMNGGVTVLYAGLLYFLDPLDTKHMLLSIAAAITTVAVMIFTSTNWSENVARYEELTCKHQTMYLNLILKQPFTPEMCHFLFSAKIPLPRIFYSQLSLMQVMEGTNGDLKMLENLMPYVNPYVRETLSDAIELYDLKIGDYKETPFIKLLSNPEYKAKLLNSADLLRTIVFVFKRHHEFQSEWEEIDRFEKELTPLILERLKQHTLTLKFSDNLTCRVAKRIFCDTFLESLPGSNFCYMEETTLRTFHEISLVLYAREEDLIEPDVVSRVINLATMLEGKIQGMSQLIKKCQRLTNHNQEEYTNL